jgi:hypothetical protein
LAKKKISNEEANRVLWRKYLNEKRQRSEGVNVVVSLLTYCSAGDPFLFWESVDLSSPVDHQLRKDYRSQR